MAEITKPILLDETGQAIRDAILSLNKAPVLTEEDKQAIIDELFDALKNNLTTARIGEVSLLASAWVGSGNLYHQVVSVDGVTANSQVDLTPDVEQLAVFYEKDLTFVTENENGVVTVYAIGQKPTNDYIVQVTITEVDV